MKSYVFDEADEMHSLHHFIASGVNLMWSKLIVFELNMSLNPT